MTKIQPFISLSYDDMRTISKLAALAIKIDLAMYLTAERDSVSQCLHDLSCTLAALQEIVSPSSVGDDPTLIPSISDECLELIEAFGT